MCKSQRAKTTTRRTEGRSCHRLTLKALLYRPMNAPDDRKHTQHNHYRSFICFLQIRPVPMMASGNLTSMTTQLQQISSKNKKKNPPHGVQAAYLQVLESGGSCPFSTAEPRLRARHAHSNAHKVLWSHIDVSCHYWGVCSFVYRRLLVWMRLFSSFLDFFF